MVKRTNDLASPFNQTYSWPISNADLKPVPHDMDGSAPLVDTLDLARKEGRPLHKQPKPAPREGTVGRIVLAPVGEAPPAIFDPETGKVFQAKLLRDVRTGREFLLAPPPQDPSARGTFGIPRILAEVDAAGGITVMWFGKQVRLADCNGKLLPPTPAARTPKTGLSRRPSTASARSGFPAAPKLDLARAADLLQNRTPKLERSTSEDVAREMQLPNRVGSLVQTELYLEDPEHGNAIVASAILDCNLHNVQVHLYSGRWSAFTRPMALHVLRGLLEELKSAEEKSFCHRDIKSLNVLVERGGEVGLCDWGNGAAIDSAHHRTPSYRYAAPEAIVSAPEGAARHKVDLWGLGATVVDLLIGDGILWHRLDRAGDTARFVRANADLGVLHADLRAFAAGTLQVLDPEASGLVTISRDDYDAVRAAHEQLVAENLDRDPARRASHRETLMQDLRSDPVRAARALLPFLPTDAQGRKHGIVLKRALAGARKDAKGLDELKTALLGLLARPTGQHAWESLHAHEWQRFCATLPAASWEAAEVERDPVARFNAIRAALLKTGKGRLVYAHLEPKTKISAGERVEYDAMMADLRAAHAAVTDPGAHPPTGLGEGARVIYEKFMDLEAALSDETRRYHTMVELLVELHGAASASQASEAQVRFDGLAREAFATPDGSRVRQALQPPAAAAPSAQERIIQRGKRLADLRAAYAATT
ncbi:MAG TPA: serine/threonine-protein kinase, partial [Myxococcota bacterium]|nr:serine/threonine-protein kinase [Myxococcota bacterium]